MSPEIDPTKKVASQSANTHDEVRRILDSCVRYGFCTNTCPTYVLSRDENESPRGRIALIRDMMEADDPPHPETVRHIDSCLGCLSCMTTCAAKVDYHHLIDHARAHIEQRFRRPLLDRILRGFLVAFLPHPKRFRVALHAAPLGQLIRWLDPRISAMLDLRPDSLPQPPDLRRDRSIFPAEGKRRGRVVLLTGCVQRVIADHVNQAAIRLLCRHGTEVVVLSQVECCGALALHLGHVQQAGASASALAKAIFDEHHRGPIDAVVITASGCGTTVKDYVQALDGNEELAEAASLTARLACDITEYLTVCGLRSPVSETSGVPVAYHDACSLQHGQKITTEPRTLLKQAGFKVHNAPESHLCCGSAGTYNLLHPQTAETLGRRKAGHLDSTGASVIAAGNLGCMTQIRRFSELAVVHTVELLDWATGGPIPPALTSVALARHLPEEETAPAALSEVDQLSAKRSELGSTGVATTKDDSFW